MRVVAVLLACEACLGIALCELSACTGNHSSLAKGEGGSAPGGAGTGAGAHGGGGTAGATSSTSSSGGQGGEPEPAGTTKLTIVNGIVDWDGIRLCATPYPAGGDSQPWPVNDAVGFARSRVIDPPTTLVPSDSDVELHVIGGDLAQSYGQSCNDLLALPPPADDAGAPLLIASLGVIPSSVWATERSLLLVPYGCLGGPDHSAWFETQVCGAGYVAGSPNVGLAAVAMSRITDADRVSWQFVDAVPAIVQAQLRMHAGIEAATGYLVTQYWSLGGIAPYPPWTQFSLSQLGSLPDAAVGILSTSPSFPSTEVTLGAALGNSDLTVSDIVDGAGLVLVAVGAAPTEPDGPWWHGLTLTMVRADP